MIPTQLIPVLRFGKGWLAVNKPAGLLVHRTSLDRQATENAMHIVRDQLGQWVYPFHRLDKATSGVLLFALDQETTRRMTQSFTDGAVSKSYLAVVRGYTTEAGRIEHRLKEIADRMNGQNVDQERPGKEAVTEYRRSATAELPCPVGRYATARYSLIEALPLTGGSHQIRRHLKHIFHPVIGDTTHGDSKHNELFRKELDSHRLLLHAQEISFVRLPRTKKFTWTSDAEILLGYFKPVSGTGHDVKPSCRIITARLVCNQNTKGLFRAPAYTATQLVKLGESKPLGVDNDHD